MTQIKFGTDGWRAVIAKEYTTENVARVAQATALWALSKTLNPIVVVGHDCRFGGELFAETVAKVLSKNNIKVLLAQGFVSTPMVSLGVLKSNAFLGVIITASHNPAEYNGYKLKGSFGGPLLEEDIHEVESLISDSYSHDIDEYSIEHLVSTGIVERIDLETLYCNYLEEKFDLNEIRDSKWEFAFDAMYGSGQNVMLSLIHI